MRRELLTGLCFAAAVAGTYGWAADAKDTTAIERGRDAVRGRPALNSPLWNVQTVEQVWKQWGLNARPKDFERLFRERYGLHAAPYDNHGLPMGMHISSGLLGKGVITDCLMCHARNVAGQTIIGLGNASLDAQGLIDELGTSGLIWKFPVSFSHVRGTLDVMSPVAFLMELRDPDLEFAQKPAKLDYVDNVCSDPPAWWLLKRKKTRNWSGGVDARSVRLDMVNILGPFNDGAFVRKQESVFADIHAFIMSVESPKFPFAIDGKLAEQGRPIFNKTCAKCHGTYGPDGQYPNKVVPLDKLGTDPVLARSLTKKNRDHINKSWLSREKTADGTELRLRETGGYQAPPLDGVWATAPYFPNASVPTVYHVLNSKARPRIWTRSYGTGKEDYDPAKLGWKIDVLERPPSREISGIERRKIYDTTLPGRSNAGHTFGDAL